MSFVVRKDNVNKLKLFLFRRDHRYKFLQVSEQINITGGEINDGRVNNCNYFCIFQYLKRFTFCFFFINDERNVNKQTVIKYKKKKRMFTILNNGSF